MFTKSKDHNPNYLATFVALKNVRKHPNADRLQVTTIYANNIITGLDAKEDAVYIYFPIESAICREFLSYTNSFEDSTLNNNQTVKGFFDKNGRVRAMTLRGQKSEGYVVPLAVFEDFCTKFLGLKSSVVKFDKVPVGTEFDQIGELIFCKKYVPRNSRTPGEPGKKKTKGNVKKYTSKLIENQFRFHYDTLQLKRNVGKIDPNDLISITNKIHGTSFVVSNVLVKKKLGIWQGFLKLLGAEVKDSEYGMLYSSRTVIKNQNFEVNPNAGFYGADVWKMAATELFPNMQEGISVYGELVGYTPNGGWIQKDYDYGCEAGKFDTYVYRVTYTSPTGNVYEFSHHQVQEWCKRYNVKFMEVYYYGYAKDLFPELDVAQHWHDNFLQKLIDTYLEKDCHICKNKVPDEGIILRKDNVHDYEAFKLKSFKFLKKETDDLDKGVVDIETQESQGTEDAAGEVPAE